MRKVVHGQRGGRRHGHTLGIPWAYLGHTLGIPWAYLWPHAVLCSAMPCHASALRGDGRDRRLARAHGRQHALLPADQGAGRRRVAPGGLAQALGRLGAQRPARAAALLRGRARLLAVGHRVVGRRRGRPRRGPPRWAPPSPPSPACPAQRLPHMDRREPLAVRRVRAELRGQARCCASVITSPAEHLPPMAAPPRPPTSRCGAARHSSIP